MLPDVTFMNAGTGPDARVDPWATAAWISDYQPSLDFRSRTENLAPD
jgi:hypothetical protein